VQRRLTLVVPEVLHAGENAQVYVGFDKGVPGGEPELVVRLSVLNGEPETQQQAFQLNGGGAAHTAFHVTAGDFTQVRLRLEAFQADGFSGDLHVAGGMYVDLDVTTDESERGMLAAFGTDVTVLPI
jgi:hypothetical protein